MEEIQKLARELMSRYGLDHWEFRFNNRETSAGRCIYPLQGKSGILELSRPFCNTFSIEETRDTILHEIAHALTPGDGHGHRWQEMCKRIGARPEPFSQELPGEYQARCCRTYQRRKKPSPLLDYFCTLCGELLHFRQIGQVNRNKAGEEAAVSRNHVDLDW